MAISSKTNHQTPIRQTRKTSSNYGQGSPANEAHPPDPLHLVKRELISRIDDFLKSRLEWDELVLNRSLGLVIKIMNAEKEDRLTAQNSRFPPKYPGDDVIRRDPYAWKKYSRLNEYYSELKAILADMTKLAFKIQESNSDFEALVFKSCNPHGTQRIFDGPIGLTWPLPQICDHLIGLSSQYIHSLQFHHSLYNAIVSRHTPMPEKQAAAEFPDFFTHNVPNSTPRKQTPKK
ncbi:hypothetical protein PCANC_12496 [Puccinia coronata f. sp. avenae]|uniref:Uncharacterized protein n=1 Tax=Puccinia coronata f. sp. avenae TaxID=200324 RepID=A0A2N5TXF9_9BASI|nr:hypothetical protein PCASD_18503 [Puccinia coronata f. sp. avenae]PLW30152.1 hypothetical protein PCANC_24521 [Puccinia coronata f. sp. avenae]PLW38470.1 hypothetical protein PCANC_12496 [Puccinia coronata f. sp. avenae]PLW45149.1 hypothetical protein PCASD_04528 [Puccinia coronata f. sp. avenae]